MSDDVKEGFDLSENSDIVITFLERMRDTRIIFIGETEDGKRKHEDVSNLSKSGTEIMEIRMMLLTNNQQSNKHRQ